MDAARSIPLDPPAAPPSSDVARFDTLVTLLHPTLADLAATLGLSPLQLVDWLASPAVADRLATLTAAAESLNNLLSLSARAPALAAARALLEPPNPASPAEQCRIVTALLRSSSPRPIRTRTSRPPAPNPSPPRVQNAHDRGRADPAPPTHPAPSTVARPPAISHHEHHTSLPASPGSPARPGCEQRGADHHADLISPPTPIPQPLPPRPRRGVPSPAHALLAAAGMPSARPP